MKNKTLATAVLLCWWISPLAGAADGATMASDSKPGAAGKPTPAAAPADTTGTPSKESSVATVAAWQGVIVEAGRRVEIDQASIKKLPDGKIQAYGRILFDKPLPDAMSGSTYQTLETLNTYDCEKRTYATSRRIYRKDEKTLLRDENNLRKTELPVRSGTLDEKLFRVACRPGATDPKGSFSATVAEAKAVANEPVPEVRKELMRTELGNGVRPVAKPAHPAPVPARATLSRAKPGTKATGNIPPARSTPIPWSYDGAGGPAHWSQLSPENTLCDQGQRQSPIDIVDGIRVDLPPIGFDYRASLFRIIDTGSTVQAAVGENRIRLIGKEYDLIQFHFHRPGEERVNGRNSEMTAHLVHKAYDGQLAIISIPIERGNENPLIQTLWNYLPLERNVDVFPPGVPIDLNDLLPKTRGYYTYMGSLTTPPCSEGVLWLILQSPIQASAEQIGIFSRLYSNNIRPIQPLNGRLIKESR